MKWDSLGPSPGPEPKLRDVRPWVSIAEADTAGEAESIANAALALMAFTGANVQSFSVSRSDAGAYTVLVSYTHFRHVPIVGLQSSDHGELKGYFSAN